jgi:DNA recombination protein RmuC
MLLLIVAVLQVLVLIAVVVLLVRRPAREEDPRLAAIAAELPGLSEKATRVEARLGSIEQASERSAAALRKEVLETIQLLGATLNKGLDGFRADNTRGAEALRSAVEGQLNGLSQRFASFASETARAHAESREALHAKLKELSAEQRADQEQLRRVVQEGLDKLNQDNTAKLEEMRLTVDEKLHATLEARLTTSFGLVTDQLTKVSSGLGEMNTLAAGVNDLNRIFSNVKTRGGFAEVQLGKLLEQVLAPGQYVENAKVKPGTQEAVEYAVRFPGASGEVLLPIDAKFPREDWERLETAYEEGSNEEIEQARRAFDAAIRTEGKRICSKYINEPVTTPYAIMFLPTESLYAEVLRRDGLQSELHLNCRVMVAGPSNLYALLTSFQLGFRMLNLQKKGDEVWKILGKTQTEFKNFEVLMASMEKQVGTVQNTIQKLGTRTRAINRTLKNVAEVDGADSKVLQLDGFLPMLAAEQDE